MSRCRILDRSKPYRTLYSNPRGARYKQGGQLFNCGGIHIADLDKVKDKEPTKAQIEGHDELINDAKAEAAKIIADAKAEAEKLMAGAPGNTPTPSTVTPNVSDLNIVPGSENNTPTAKEEGKKESTSGKLNNALAVEIRERIASGGDPTMLAQEYGVSETSIHNVVTGKTYKDAGGPIKA